jgi:hypothetical protein
MQNRESAIRSRMKKKENNKQLEVELDFLKSDNYRLFHENKSLKNEKSFLIEQIKFMQSLIKSNTLVKSSEDIEKNTKTDSSSNSQIYMNGAKQRRPFGKLFSVFVICVLSVAYVSFDSPNTNTGKIEFNNGSMSLNDVQSGGIQFYYIWYILKIVLIICLLVIVLVMYNWICDSFEKKNTKNDKCL